jgi:hypothetical protein
MSGTNITRLGDAKAMRAMGAPLNTPMEDRRFSPRSEKKIYTVYKATSAFGDAVMAWVENQEDGKRFAAVCRTWDKLNDALTKAHSQPKWTEHPDGSGELVYVEAVAVNVFIQPCGIVCSQWDEILTALENGEPVPCNRRGISVAARSVSERGGVMEIWLEGGGQKGNMKLAGRQYNGFSLRTKFLTGGGLL